MWMPRKRRGSRRFFQSVGGKLSTTDMDITCGNEYGTVWAVAMDDVPLKTSKKILVQVGTQCHPTDWKQTPVTIELKEGKFEGFRIDDTGHAPYQVVSPLLVLTVRNTGLTKATALDANGNAQAPVAVTKSPTGVRFTFPNNALYVVLQ